MKQVLLHIGMHKTGSTSIQQSFAGYDDGRTRFARLGHENHSVPLVAIFSERRYEFNYWRDRGAARSEIDAVRQRSLRALEREVSNAERDRLILSSEVMEFFSPAEKAELVRYFTDRGVEVRILCFVRRPEAIVASFVQQVIKQSAVNLHEYALHYRATIEPFEALVPRSAITVLDYDDLTRAHDGNIVPAFAQLLGLRDVETKRTNEALSAQAIRLLYRLNELPVRTLGSADRAEARRRFVELLSRLYPSRGKGTRLDRSAFLHLVPDSARADCEFLREHYGIDFDPPEASFDPERLARYLRDTSEIDIEPLRSALKTARFETPDGMTVDECLLELFLAIVLPTVRTDTERDYARTVNRLTRAARKLRRLPSRRKRQGRARQH